MAEKGKTVAVFIYDGTDKYSAMTLNAIKSFLAASQGAAPKHFLPIIVHQASQ